MARKAIGNARRFKVFQRDGFRCQYCGRVPPAVVLHVDHVVPVAEGGGNEDANLLTACSDCNHGKRDRIIDASAVPRDYAAMTEDAKQRRSQLKAYREHLELLRVEVDQAIDMVGAEFFGPGLTWSYERSARLRGQVERFINLLGLGAVADAARITRTRGLYETQSFRYFCGICWNRCTERGISTKREEE